MPCPNCSCSSCLPNLGSLGMSLRVIEFPPPPSELMTTNRAPTDSEVASSRAIINSAEKRLSMIRTMSDDLERQKAKLLGLVRAHRTAISRLKSFPPEVLVEVFAEWAAFAGDFSRSRTPLLIATKICSRWRRIALDAPRLWTRILKYSPRPIIDSWIVRSKELPLRVRWSFFEGATSKLGPAPEALVQHAHRWGRVNFTLGSGSNSHLAPVKARLKSLERLKLVCMNDGETVDFCEVAPRLTEIKLEFISPSLIIKLPWEQLRVCTVDNSGVALDILQRATNLWTFRLDMNKPHDATPPMPRSTHVHHVKLDTFIIDWGPKDHSAPSFFASLTLPSLRTLDVCLPDSPRAGDEDDVNWLQFASIMFEFLERSSTHLTTLSLMGTPLSPGQLICCLELAPSLVSLDIRYDKFCSYAINDGFLYILTADHPGFLLHQLKSLSLRGRCYFSEESMNAFLTSRRNINPTDVHRVALLENLALDGFRRRDWFTHQLPLFHRFVSGGLNITYRHDY